MFNAELTAEVDAVWGEFCQEVDADPARVVDRITSLVAGDQLSNAAETLPSADAVQDRLHDYLSTKLSSSGVLVPEATPHTIASLMVKLSAPTPRDTIMDPAAGTAGLLGAAADFLRENHPEIWLDPRLRDHFDNAAFSGVDSTASVCGIALMGLRLRGVGSPRMVHADPLSESRSTTERYSLVLSRLPESGLRTGEAAARVLLRAVRTKRVELLSLANVLRLLSVGGRAVVIVPDTLLSGTSKAHLDLRRMLVTEHRLEAVVRLPAGALSERADRPSSILVVRKLGTTDDVWFYDLRNERAGSGGVGLGPEGRADLLARWRSLETTPSSERSRRRNAQSFVVGLPELTEQDFDLTFDRYRIVVAEFIAHRAPNDILVDIARLELRIQQGTAALARAIGDGTLRTLQ